MHLYMFFKWQTMNNVQEYGKFSLGQVETSAL